MPELNLKVLTPAEFVFLETRKPDGVYNYETQDKLHKLIEKLKAEKNNLSRVEKKLCKVFNKVNFGILIDQNSGKWARINHPGKVRVTGTFKGEIIAQAVLIEKTGSVAANIAAEVVMCKGKVLGDIRATHKIKITQEAEVKGDIHSSSFVIEKGAVFDGRCSMPNIVSPLPLPLLGDAFQKTG